MPSTNFDEVHTKYLQLEKEMDGIQSLVCQKESELNKLRKKLSRITKEYEQYKNVVLAFMRIKDK